MLTVSAKYLRTGDYLIATNRKVIWIGRTLQTPTGKITVITQSSTGRRSCADWWQGTQIGIQRPEPSEGI